MNLLYLANVVVAEVSEDYYWHWTHDQEIGKALVAACATVIAALIAITGVFLTARKTTQQIELSKQGKSIRKLKNLGKLLSSAQPGSGRFFPFVQIFVLRSEF